MDWVWIAALGWVVLSLLLALIIGWYLRRSDERDTRIARAGGTGAPTHGPQPAAPSAQGGPRSRRRRARPFSSPHMLASPLDRDRNTSRGGEDPSGSGADGRAPGTEEDRPRDGTARQRAGARWRTPPHRRP